MLGKGEPRKGSGNPTPRRDFALQRNSVMKIFSDFLRKYLSVIVEFPCVPGIFGIVSELFCKNAEVFFKGSPGEKVRDEHIQKFSDFIKSRECPEKSFTGDFCKKKIRKSSVSADYRRNPFCGTDFSRYSRRFFCKFRPSTFSACSNRLFRKNYRECQ